MTIWTPEMDKWLAELCRDGLKYSEIAETMKCSRSAALGRAYRLKIPSAFGPYGRGTVKENGSHGGKRTPRAPATIGRQGHGLHLSNRPLTKAEQRQAARELAALAPATDSDGQPITLLSATRGQCLFPLGEPTAEMAVCGHETSDGRSYCTYHRRLTHIPAKPTKQERPREMEEREAA